MINVQKRLSSLKKSDFAKNVFKLVSGTAIAQVVPIAISPVLTRIYTPKDFGTLALFVSITTFFSVIATGKYELAIILPEKDKDGSKLVILSFIINVIVSILLLILVIIFHDFFTRALSNEDIGPWLYFVPLVVFLTGGFEVLKYYSIRHKLFSTISKATVFKSITLALFQVVIGITKIFPGGLIVGNIFSNFSSNAPLLRPFLAANKGEYINNYNVRELKSIAIKYKNFPKFSLLSSVLNSGSLQIPVLIFSAFFSKTFLGLYSLSQRVLSMPMSLIGSAIGQVYYQKAAEVRDDQQKLQVLSWKMYKTLLLIGVFPLGFLTVFGKQVFGFVFGADWAIGGYYAEMLSVWILFVFVSSPLSTLFFIQERQKEGLIFQLFVFISRISVLVGSIFLFRDEVITLRLFGWTSALLFFSFCLYFLGSLGLSKWKVVFFTACVISLVLAPLFFIKIYFFKL